MAKSSTNPTGTAAKQSFDSLEQEVYLNLWRTYDRLKFLEDEVFGRVGLSAQQYNALRLLRSVHPDAMPTLVLESYDVTSARRARILYTGLFTSSRGCGRSPR